MSIANTKKFYYLIILVSFLVIVFSLYYQLGGFRQLNVEVYEQVDYAIAGREFRGSYKDPAIEEIYQFAKEQVATGKIAGTLCVIDYPGEDLGENEVNYFIGVLLLDKITELPTNYTVRRIQSPGALGVSLDTHPIVRPTKDDVEARINETALAYNLRIRDYFLEKHYADDRLVIEAFLE